MNTRPNLSGDAEVDRVLRYTPSHIFRPGLVDHIGERAVRAQYPPHTGIGFIWNNLREGFGVGHRANLQHFAGPSRIHSIQRDLIRLNRILPAGRPYCLEPAPPTPGAALLGTARSCRGIVPFTHLAREGRMTVTIGRRELLVALGGAAAWPLAARLTCLPSAVHSTVTA